MEEPEVNSKTKKVRDQELYKNVNNRYRSRFHSHNPLQRVYLPLVFSALIVLICTLALIILLNIFLNPTLSTNFDNHFSMITPSISHDNLSIEEQSAMGELKQLTDSCRIKGEVIPELSAKIYILPGQKYYDQTIIRPEFGGRVFCSEKDAVSNGWTKSKA